MRKGLISVVLLQLAFAAVQFLQVPLFLAHWGPERYGVWLLLQILQLLMSRSDFGLAIATSKEITMRAERGDQAGAIQVYQTAYTAICACQVILLGMLCAAIWVFRGQIGSLHLSFSDFAWTAIFMALGGFMMAHVEALYAAFYASGIFRQGIFVRAAAQVSWFICVAVAVFAGANLPQAAAAMFVGWVAPVIVALIILKWQKSPFVPRLRLQFGELRSLVAPSLSMASLPAAQIISLSAPRLIVGAIAGPAGLALFNAHRQLTRIVALVFGLSIAIEPSMTVAIGRNDNERFLDLAVDCQLIVAAVTAAALLGLVIVGPFIFPIWTGGTTKFAVALFVPLALCAALESLWRSVMAALTAANEHVRAGLSYILVNVFGFLLLAAASLVVHIGTVGLSWALVLIELLTLLMVSASFLAYTRLPLSRWSEHTFVRGKRLSERVRGAIAARLS